MNVSKQQRAILTFRLADHFYALPIENVIEVVAMMTVTQIPNSPDVILGMINRHGEALPMLDLRVALDYTASIVDESTLFIVAQDDHHKVGLVVDEILQVKYIDVTAFKDAQGAGKYISHIISADHLYQQIRLQALYRDYLTPIQ